MSPLPLPTLSRQSPPLLDGSLLVTALSRGTASPDANLLPNWEEATLVTGNDERVDGVGRDVVPEITDEASASLNMETSRSKSAEGVTEKRSEAPSMTDPPLAARTGRRLP